MELPELGANLSIRQKKKPNKTTKSSMLPSLNVDDGEIPIEA